MNPCLCSSDGRRFIFLFYFLSSCAMCDWLHKPTSSICDVKFFRNELIKKISFRPKTLVIEILPQNGLINRAIVSILSYINHSI